MVLQHISKFWNSYKYRFVPWLSFNIKGRKIRTVRTTESDKIISSEKVKTDLTALFTAIHIAEEDQTTGSQNKNKIDLISLDADPMYKKNLMISSQNKEIMKTVCGFTTELRKSLIHDAGQGLFVSSGKARQGSILAMYPGTLYKPGEPILFQSLGNPFVFKCIDGTYIDGSNRLLSKYIFRSCTHRDIIDVDIADISWLDEHPFNPLAFGQYVNNQSTEFPANVAYQEFDIDEKFPVELFKYIPNVHFSAPISTGWSETRTTRIVVLVSTRDIEDGEEIFSNYITMVHS